MWYSSGGWQLILCRIRDGGWGIIKLFSPKITERWGFDGKRQGRASGWSPSEGADRKRTKVRYGFRADEQQVRRLSRGVLLREHERYADRVECERYFQASAGTGRDRASAGSRRAGAKRCIRTAVRGGAERMEPGGQHRPSEAGDRRGAGGDACACEK